MAEDWITLREYLDLYVRARVELEIPQVILSMSDEKRERFFNQFLGPDPAPERAPLSYWDELWNRAFGE
jgi:hypothetical protein